MTDDWDFYFCRIDDKPASIFVDLGAIHQLPVASHPVMAYLRLYLRAPRADGLSGNDAYDDLLAIEHALEALCDSAQVLYAGRCTSDGCRDFYFYAQQNCAWQERAELCMQAFPEYRFECGSRDDPDWACYRSFLYPNAVAHLSIQDRRVCQLLQSHGDALSVARDLDHYVLFCEAGERQAFISEALAMGYTAGTPSPASDDGTFGIQITRCDVPSLEGIDGITGPLTDLAERHGGSYDGWGCQVVRPLDPSKDQE